MVEKKLDRRVKYTKMVIEESFLTLLKEKPITKITIKELCELAELNRATFYAHYLDTYDLFTQIQNSILNDVIHYLENQEFKDFTEATPLKATEALMDYIKENAEVLDLFLNKRGDLFFQQAITDIIAKQQFAAMSFSKPVTHEQVDYLLYFMASGSVSIVQKWLKEGLKLTSREISYLILQFCNSGRTSLL